MASWRTRAYRAARPLLFTADPETIHRAAMRLLATAGGNAPGRAICRLAGGVRAADAAGAPVDLLGLRFRNRVGVGAGFDKDGVAARGWASLGLGFVELGTVTPRPQPGNPRPRVFRLPGDGALVNRMGFNNAGASTLAARVAAVRPRLPPRFVIGVNIGRNRDTPDEAAVDDYVAAATTVAPVADYLAINVSSPNTPGLRALQEPGRLATLVGALDDIEPRRPLLVKLSPDLEPDAFEALVASLAGSPAAGLIISNTTTARPPDLRGRHADEEGGLSGAPLLPGMLAALSRARTVAGDRLALVASGGIGSAADAQAALAAGADLVQLWTGLVYSGPGLIGETVRRAC